MGEYGNAPVYEHVLPLPDNVQAGSATRFGKLRQPRIVRMATQIAGFDAAMPIAGNDQKSGQRRYRDPRVSKKTQRPAY